MTNHSRNRFFVYALTTIVIAACFFSEWKAYADNSNRNTSSKLAYYTIQGYMHEHIPNPMFVNLQTDQSLFDYLRALDSIARDKDVKAVIIEIFSPYATISQLNEIRQALVKVKKAGIPVYIYGESLSNSEYLLASLADKILISPAGEIECPGLYMETVFLKDLLDWFGIEANIVAMGDYKGSPEMYTRSGASDYFKEEINNLLDDWYMIYAKTLAEGRKIPLDKMKSIIDVGYYGAQEAKELGLITDTMYLDEFKYSLRREFGSTIQIVENYKLPAAKQLEADSLNNILQLFSLFQSKPVQQSNKDKIAVIFAEGMIYTGYSTQNYFGSSVMGSKTIAEAFKMARENPTVKAIVFRVNSGGGSHLASDTIWHEVELTNKLKPVIVSMGQAAASGGYYVSVASDTIFANPWTITGSIGVYGGKFNLKGLYEKIGINKEVFKRGQNSGIFSDYSGFSDSEQKVVMKSIQRVYKQFVQIASKGRNMTYAQMDELAQGRVYSGDTAKKIGLVDEVGNLQDAIDMAFVKAKIEPDASEILILPPPKSFLEIIQEMFTLELFNMGLSWMKEMIYQSGLQYFDPIIIKELLEHENKLLLLPASISVH